MNRDEAQFILAAYRPNGEDAGDDDFREALTLAERDPELRDWLVREQAMDRIIAAKLREVAPPDGLRLRILTGARISRKPSWFRQPRWLALAALAMLFSLLGGYFFRPVHADNFPEFAMHYAERGFLLQAHAKNLPEIHSWLAERKMPAPSAIPAPLAALEKLGCRTIRYAGRDISVICFQGDREYHLFVAKRTPASRSFAEWGEHGQSSGKWSAVAWSDAEHDYVLASEGDQKSLERLL